MTIVTTDRQSAFDRILASVPFKGQVLNGVARWWLEQTSDIAPNALLGTPHPNVAVMRQCEVFPVEFVMRGFITGSTSTSLWTHYADGEREYCGHSFPDGLRKNDRLEANVLTPTTKSVEHDVPVSLPQVVEMGLMSAEDAAECARIATALFERGQKVALERGLLLVDTKYEMGKDKDGNIMVIDEVHTPDSSRYWLAHSYEARHAERQEPENVDKVQPRTRAAQQRATASDAGARPLCGTDTDSVRPSPTHRSSCGSGSVIIVTRITTPSCPRRPRSWWRSFRGGTCFCTRPSPARSSSRLAAWATRTLRQRSGKAASSPRRVKEDLCKYALSQ